MNATTTTILAAAALAAGASAQASFTNYGRGCGLPGSPPPLIRFTGLPQVGMSYTINQVALPNSITPVSIDLPILISGLQQTMLPVPTYSSLQPAGCFQLCTIDVFEIMPQVSPNGFQTSATWTVPNNPNLVGLQYHHQWASLYSSCRPTCTAGMVRVSDAAIVTVGL